MPLEWIGYQDAVRLIALEQVSYFLGKTLYKIRGGINAISGLQSESGSQRDHRHLGPPSAHPPFF